MNAENPPDKVLLIGPVLPFRGGIAQHTTLLYRALSKRVACELFSFKRQYPAWLFPGESDRDPDYAGYLEPGARYLIDSLDPFTWRRAVTAARRMGVTRVVIPWWTIFWAPCFGYLARALRRQGMEVVFFCHNVVEHEAAWWKTKLSRLVLGAGSRFVVHTREDRANLVRLLPGARVQVHPHPIYDQFPPPEGTLPRKAALELLFYGFVRPYKGLELLIEAMGRLRGQDVHLVVAGEFWEGQEAIEAQIRRLGIEQQVELRPRYHSDQETALLFHRADAVVLPYRSATGSGVVPIAYHYDKPVIVTRVGGLPDVVEEGKTGFVVPPEDVAALADAIERLGRSDRGRFAERIREYKGRLSWDSLAEVVLDSGDSKGAG